MLATDLAPEIARVLPKHRDLFYGGAWHEPHGGYLDTINPATGVVLGEAAEADAADVDAAVAAAKLAFASWRKTKPLDRAKMLRKIAAVLRDNADDLAMIDAANCGNPVAEMASDAHAAATVIDFFAGLVTEAKGTTIPMGDGVVNMTLREPYGVCARVVAYNHPMMFTAAKLAAPLAAGNVVIMKPPPQAPLSGIRLAELIGDVVPAGVLNILTGGRVCGEALVAHRDTPVVTLIGSVPSGQAVAAAAGKRLKHVILELGGKNALIVYPDADIDRAIAAAVRGMNFTWCGQSCGSTSRLFVHDSVYDRVLTGVVAGAKAYVPGIPTDPKTTMGAIISKAQHDKILSYIKAGHEDGAKLVLGGDVPQDSTLASGFFVNPTIFGDVAPGSRLAREEVFGPILSVIRWTDEDAMFDEVNAVDYGLTGAVHTKDLATAHRAAARLESGYVWINGSAAHFLGAPFGGYKQSGIGREESIEELLGFTQQKNVNITL